MRESHYNSVDTILLALKKGDNNVLRFIYKTYWPMILHFVSINNGSAEDAEELFQEGIIALYEKVKTPHFTLTCSLKTYLYSICRNKWLCLLRDKKTMVNIEDYIELPTEDDDVENIILPEDEAIYDAINEMGNPCRNLLVGFYYDRLSLEDLSEKYNYANANVVKQQKFRCIERLKNLFLFNKQSVT